MLLCAGLWGLAGSALIAQDYYVMALRYNTETQSRTFARYNASKGIIEKETELPFLNFLMGSSTQDAYRGLYYVTSVKDNSSDYGVTSIETATGAVATSPLNENIIPIEAEFDYSNGMLYGLRKGRMLAGDSMLGGIISAMEFVSTNPETGNVTLKSEFTDINAVSLNTSCYNSNKGIYIFAGVNFIDGENKLRIYWIDASTGQLLRRTEPLEYNIGEMIYDNLNDRLLAIIHNNDAGSLSVINDNGEAQPVTPLQINGYIASSTAFDQLSSRYILNMLIPGYPTVRTVVINTLNGEVESDVPALVNLNEWEIDNSYFANTRYGTTSVNQDNEQNIAVSVFPNPVQENTILIQGLTQQAVLDLYSADGVQISTMQAMPGQAIQLPALQAGVYMLQCRQGTQLTIHKLMIVK